MQHRGTASGINGVHLERYLQCSMGARGGDQCVMGPFSKSGTLPGTLYLVCRLNNNRWYLLSAFYVTGIVCKCCMSFHIIPSSHLAGEKPWHRGVQ